MDRIDACMRVLDSALTYATDTSDALSFPNQIRPNYDPARPDDPAELAYITKPWSDLAFYPPPSHYCRLREGCSRGPEHPFRRPA
jgi:hypothetical protein